MDQVERNRLEEFRQLRQEVRHSEKYLIVGIDIAKERHHAFFGTPTGRTLLKRLVFSNDHEGFRRLLDQTEALRVQQGLKKVVYGMEPTANYHKPLGEYLIIPSKPPALPGDARSSTFSGICILSHICAWEQRINAATID